MSLKDQIQEKLTQLNTRADGRNTKLANIHTLFGLLDGLLTRINVIVESGARSPDGRAPLNMEVEMQAIKRLVDELERKSAESDNRTNDIEAQLIDKTTKLVRIYERLVQNNPARKGDADEYLRAVNAHLQGMRQGPPGARGGYKHSKTNSRKYMVKRFRSARNSYKKRRRRGKTLRRNNRRKL